MGITLRIKVNIIFAALQAACRHIFRTGYFPREWPLKLSIIMGICKAIFGFFPSATIEEVVRLTIALTNQGTRIYECGATFEGENRCMDSGSPCYQVE